MRWFILSDSPPEKDIQWSDTGVAASNKFLQKIWNLNLEILQRKEIKSNQKLESKLSNEIEIISSKIDNSISNFKFNVTIALFYEAYNTLNRYSNLEIKNKYLINSITKIMKLLIPFIPI